LLYVRHMGYFNLKVWWTRVGGVACDYSALEHYTKFYALEFLFLSRRGSLFVMDQINLVPWGICPSPCPLGTNVIEMSVNVTGIISTKSQNKKKRKSSVPTEVVKMSLKPGQTLMFVHYIDILYIFTQLLHNFNCLI